jgi:hypothetical protein
MELFISTSAKEKEVKTAFIIALRKISGYNLRTTDLHVGFLCGGTEVVEIQFAVQSSRDAFCLIDFLYNDPGRFFEELAADTSEELFKYLLFNNRISHMSSYLNLYKKVRLTISEKVFGETFRHEFIFTK